MFLQMLNGVVVLVHDVSDETFEFRFAVGGVLPYSFLDECSVLSRLDHFGRTTDGITRQERRYFGCYPDQIDL